MCSLESFIVNIPRDRRNSPFQFDFHVFVAFMLYVISLQSVRKSKQPKSTFSVVFRERTAPAKQAYDWSLGN